jgi:serine protease Do
MHNHVKMGLLLFVFCGLAFNCSRTGVQGQTNLDLSSDNATVKSQTVNISDLQNDLYSIAKNDTPCVVYIGTEKTVTQQDVNPFDFFFGNPGPFGRSQPRTRQYTQQALGSGVLFYKKDSSYYIITNNHVIEGADKITVVINQKKSYNGTVIGSDTDVDIAVVRIDTGDSLAIAKFGNSSNIQVGDFVVAIGNPFGLSGTMTFGIISAIGRSEISENNKPSLTDFIQTDASINPGNSGGALINMSAEVIGINTLIYSQSGGNVGIGFAIPINIAKKVAEQVLGGKKTIEHGYLGITFSEITEDGAKKLGLPSGTTGMLVSSVVGGGPADKAGLRAGDILTEVNGKKLLKSDDLTMTIGNASPGTKVTCKLLRNKQLITKDVVLGSRTEMNAVSKNNAKSSTLGDYGITVSDLTDATRNQLKIPAAINGVLITNVDSGSTADSAGAREGDVIYKVNDKVISSVEDINGVLKNNSDKQNYFYIFRGGSELIVIM